MLTLFLIIFTFVELNCENLFDTQKDSVKHDEEYTEQSLRHWTKGRYYEKLHNIGREIISCAELHTSNNQEGHIPDMVALCEVENDSVMKHLTRSTMLWSYHYEYLITHSPDTRGINTALLYNPLSFKLLESKDIRVSLPDNRPTRDILYAKGLIVSLDTLHVFVVHSPSRRGGERASRKNRMAVAERVSELIDSLPPKARIIVAGDFNDYSGDGPLRHLAEHGLTEISKDAVGYYNQTKGTYFYNGSWNSLDHIFLSPTLLPSFISCDINDHCSLMELDQRGTAVPKRSYRGIKYNNGFSDHLPLVARFNINIP